MKVLIVTSNYLSGNGGGVYCSRANINALATIYEDVTVMYPISKSQPGDIFIKPSAKLIAVENEKSRALKFLDYCVGKIHRFREVFVEELKKSKYDMIVFDRSNVSLGLIDAAREHGVAIVTIHHNYEYEYSLDNSRGILRPFNLFWTKKYERECVAKSDLNLVLTEQDRKSLSEAYGATNMETIGCFEYLPSVSKTNLPNVEENTFVITGKLDEIQSHLSIMDWVRDYYKVLTEIFPDAKIVVAGRSPSDELIKVLADRGIMIIPSPESMEPILSAAKYYICPTSMGSGLKLRVMDGLKNGLPVICHKVSSRGYESFQANGSLFVYETPSDFKSELIRLKNSSSVKKNIINSYNQIFHFDSGVERMRVIMSKHIDFNK